MAKPKYNYKISIRDNVMNYCPYCGVALSTKETTTTESLEKKCNLCLFEFERLEEL